MTLQDRCALYLVRDQKSGAVKIGISKHPETRLRQIAAHYDVGRVSIIQTTWFTTRAEARHWESNFHKRYTTFKSVEQGGREWFSLNEMQIQGFAAWMEASTSNRAIKVVTVRATAKKTEEEMSKDCWQAFNKGFFWSLRTLFVPLLCYATTKQPAAALIAPVAVGGVTTALVKSEKELHSTYGMDGSAIGSDVPEMEYRQMGLWEERSATLDIVKPAGWEFPASTTPATIKHLFEQSH